ncbi:MAG: hypothetical protein AAF217_08395 [Pseudomonadota bacterium]
MVDLILRILKSTIALPVWVILWIFLFLIPANFSGFFLLNYETGFWVALLGAGAIFFNTFILFLNGGFSKVLAIPHLILWIPLQIILTLRYFKAPDLSNFEQTYILIVLIINGISILFDIYDTREWMRGNRDVAGFPGEKVRF